MKKIMMFTLFSLCAVLQDSAMQYHKTLELTNTFRNFSQFLEAVKTILAQPDDRCLDNLIQLFTTVNQQDVACSVVDLLNICSMAYPQFRYTFEAVGLFLIEF